MVEAEQEVKCLSSKVEAYVKGRIANLEQELQDWRDIYQDMFHDEELAKQLMQEESELIYGWGGQDRSW